MKTQKEELKVRKSELKRLLKEVDKLSKKERERVEEGEVVNLQQQLIHEKRQRRLLQRQASLCALCVFRAIKLISYKNCLLTNSLS